MYKYAIFDLDGTLADTLMDLANAVNYALKENGFNTHPAEDYKQMVGSGVINLIKVASGCDDEATVNSIKACFDEYYSCHIVDNTSEYPGGEKMLMDLQAKGVQLAVLSNKSHMFVGTILKHLFPLVSFKVAWGKKVGFPVKPNPQSVNAVLKELDADKSQTVYIGDSNVDVLTAKNGEIAFIGCSWGFRGKDELREAGATVIANSCEELQKFILGEANE